MLALAGLRRLGREDGRAPLSWDRFVPAPGQGLLALETRVGRPRRQRRSRALEDPAARRRLEAERAVVEELDASCHTPVGAHARVDGERIALHAYVGLPDGSEWITDRLEASADDPRAAGASSPAVCSPPAPADLLRRAREYARRMNASDEGIVYLVGAGPGDPRLATVRAVELIEAADVIVYDRLVPPALLEHARPSAELIYVGKEPGRPSVPQEEINRLLVEHGSAGRVVVRLKGGDPFVFGRGGEEAEALAEAGVRFEVVPGVTAGVAAPAYAGIPVTHRDEASAVAFVTAHEDPAKPESALDWAALAAFPGTLVFYMGVRALPDRWPRR